MVADSDQQSEVSADVDPRLHSLVVGGGAVVGSGERERLSANDMGASEESAHEIPEEGVGEDLERSGEETKKGMPLFTLIDWVKTYPTFRFGGVEGTRVCTLAFRRTV